MRAEIKLLDEIMNHQFSNLLQKLQDHNRNVQCVALKNLASTIQHAKKSDLQEMLELLNTTHDTEIQVKLFSILAACLLSQNVNCEIIITCKPLYDKIRDALNRGLPLRTTHTLYFILALLSYEAKNGETSKKLSVFAQNFIRVSGCLTTMSSLLTSGMMYQDTWIALCHSFAEACRGSALNQSYCSHLVPLCVQICLQGNVEVFSVLQSLLHNHERNIQLFLETNGISVFTRDSLQHDTCMQLLNTIIQKSAQAMYLLRETSVARDLRQLLRSSGPYSQIGQWSTIILYRLDSHINNNNKHLKEIVTEQEVTIPDNASKNESIHQKKNVTVSHNVSIRPEFDETRNLFQNVIKEVLQWKSQNNNFKVPLIPNVYKKDMLKKSHSHSLQRKDMVSFANNYQNGQKSKRVENVFKNDFDPNLQEQERNKMVSKELSFSFLFKQNFRQMNNNDLEVDNYLSRCGLENNKSIINNYSINTTNAHTIQSTIANPRIDTSGSSQRTELRTDKNQSEIDLKEFKPAFMSTPKRQIQKKTLLLSKSKYSNNSKNVGKINEQKRSRRKPPLVEKPKQRSMSARLFSAINDSCTTFVKSFKSIFKTKKHINSEQEKTSFNTETEQLENASCSYSFTDYMRRRDAILASNCTKTDYDDFSIDMRKNSCNTCSDTFILRSKLNHNEHLKKTLMKLKMGINLYGCDFRKISNVMWPRERYMTPKVLNNLYRKLILKQ